MHEHAPERENASQLEQRLRDHGIFFPAAGSGHGFIVIGDTRIFIVEEESPTEYEGFRFQEFRMHHVQDFSVKYGEPDHKYDSNEDAEKVTDGGNKPTSHIRIWLSSTAFDFYADADPREVASAIVTKTIDTDA